MENTKHIAALQNLELKIRDIHVSLTDLSYSIYQLKSNMCPRISLSPPPSSSPPPLDNEWVKTSKCDTRLSLSMLLYEPVDWGGAENVKEEELILPGKDFGRASASSGSLSSLSFDKEEEEEEEEKKQDI